MKIKPSAIRIDAATFCQLKCPDCSTAKGIIKDKLGSNFLKYENFKKIVDASPWVRDVELSNWGEIFLNRDLLIILQYAFEHKISLRAGNGVNLNTVSEEVLEGLVKYQFQFLSCSIDGASPETYKIYRQGGDFNKVIAHIKKINAYKVQYQSSLPKLRWQFVAFGHNEHEIPLAKQMARELGMDFYVKLAHGDFSPVKNKELIRSECGAADMGEYQLKYGKSYLASKVCHQLWTQPQINADGRVLGCCVNFWGDYGNALTDDLEAILNSSKMNYARKMVLGKKTPRKDVPCASCHLYKEMQAKNQWVTLAQGNQPVYFKKLLDRFLNSLLRFKR